MDRLGSSEYQDIMKELDNLSSELQLIKESIKNLETTTKMDLNEIKVIARNNN